MTPARLSAKRWAKELRRRRVVRPSRRRKRFARAQFIRKFRRISVEEARKRKKQQIKVETKKGAPETPISREPASKISWLSKVFGRKSGG